MKMRNLHLSSKTYTTENSYRSHIISKKHKENELKAATKPRQLPQDLKVESVKTVEAAAPSGEEAGPSSPPFLKVEENATEEDIEKTIDEKIAAARSRLSPKHCLFCSNYSASLDDNLTHMSIAHSFFVPDAEYLVDINGLITYLGEKIAVGNVCIYCNAKSREFRSLDAVRKHMLDKSHCKIAYDEEEDRLEVSDFYDFTSSYPDYETRRKKKGKKSIKAPEEQEWEDVDDDGEDADEVLEVDTESGPGSSGSDESDDESELSQDELTYGDSPYELVLPSGARIGHRSLRQYYAQSFSRIPRKDKDEDPNSGSAIVRKLLADKNSVLVPRKGGFGAFGSGTDVVKARNRGEAKEAGRHMREFRDQRRREEFKTKVGFVHNHQKHYRDPLLQVRAISFLIFFRPSFKNSFAFTASYFDEPDICATL